LKITGRYAPVRVGRIQLPREFCSKDEVIFQYSLFVSGKRVTSDNELTYEASENLMKLAFILARKSRHVGSPTRKPV